MLANHLKSHSTTCIKIMIMELQGTSRFYFCFSVDNMNPLIIVIMIFLTHQFWPLIDVDIYFLREMYSIVQYKKEKHPTTSLCLFLFSHYLCKTYCIVHYKKQKTQPNNSLSVTSRKGAVIPLCILILDSHRC